MLGNRTICFSGPLKWRKEKSEDFPYQRGLNSEFLLSYILREKWQMLIIERTICARGTRKTGDIMKHHYMFVGKKNAIGGGEGIGDME
jgi:hypothetical protein